MYTLLKILFALCLCAASLCAQTRANFTGVWLLDMAHSQNYQGRPLPYVGFQLIITHNEPSIHLVNEIVFGTHDTRHLTLTLGTNGSQVIKGDTTASAWWEGNTLVVSYRAKRKKTDYFQCTRRLVMQSDGHKLSAVVDVTAADGSKAPTSGTEVWVRSDQSNNTSICQTCGH